MEALTREEIFRRLKQPFPARDILWRVGVSGGSGDGIWCMPLAYIDSRAVQDRLDHLLGPENWKNSYHAVNSGVCCRLSLRIDGEWITKSDGAGQTEIDPEKGGFSGALKRAAVLFGLGRYLYNLDSSFAEVSLKKVSGWKKAKRGDTQYWWKEPTLPEWALPGCRDLDDYANDMEDTKTVKEMQDVGKAYSEIITKGFSTEDRDKAATIYQQRSAEFAAAE
jgi:hypothetical protein